jgi:hypothetical protein
MGKGIKDRSLTKFGYNAVFKKKSSYTADPYSIEKEYKKLPCVCFRRLATRTKPNVIQCT